MPKSLVIVESPAKAKTINKYLGADFLVEASVGHVKDLPKEDLAIDVESGFVPTYQTIRGKEEVLQRLCNLAARCDRVYLATDPDREGEAIAQHIAGEISAKNDRIQRVVFNEITKSGVTSAMRAPRDIDTQMVHAQEARRVMDRLIGYKVSPFLWRTFKGEYRGLSAGRVQSVALRLVVERERAINSFIPIEYWSLIGRFRTRRDEEITARLVRYDGVEIRNPAGSAADLPKDEPRAFISTKAEAEKIRERALTEQYEIASIVKKEVKRNAPPPFTTSTLQQDAGRRLKMSGKRAMELAQKLYEGVEVGKAGRVGLITYMRTDSVRISDEAAAMAEEFIYENYGKEYLPPKRKEFKQKGKNVQDAHEAIRPTDLKITPKEARKHLDKDMAALYELIWSRFVASQMAPALIDQTTVEIAGGPFLFRATGRITRFRGWMQIYGEPEEEEKEKKGKKKGGSEENGAEEGHSADGGEGDELDGVLPSNISQHDPLRLESIETKQSHTKPPTRYTESLLVKEMEAKGIGRPSTYASIISTIQDRGYVEQRERKLYATELGMKVCDALVHQFPSLFDVKFTARMEGELDTIASGQATYLKVMQSFYGPFQRALRAVGAGGADDREEKKRLKAHRAASTPEKRGQPSDVRCEKCGSAMELRKGNYGHYLACLGFPACRNIVSADEQGKPRRIKGPAAAQPAPTEPCAKCGAPMLRRKGKSGEFFGCSKYPECRHTRPVPLGITCPSCGQGDIAARAGGRFDSIFYGCTRYPECRFTSNLRPVNRPCTKCGNTWLVNVPSPVDGDFLECPRCKVRAGAA